jgi:membrane associated rhomboid family serine protease
VSVAERVVPTTVPCPACKASLHLVTAEPLGDGAGMGDFDACFVVERGPHNDRVGHVYLLGGIPEIQVGKLSTSHVMLPGTNVSRHHATLRRLDFGPSRWQIEDQRSTNGLWVNDSRVEGAYELQDNDLVVVGEYELRYRHAPEAQPVMAAAVSGGVTGPQPALRRGCPSCGMMYPLNAKICVDCGIYVDTGKPLLTAKGYDEDELQDKAWKTIRVISWIMPTGLYPVASEGFGTRKPYVLWGLVIFTIFTSIVGFIADAGTERMDELPGTANYMLWAGDPKVTPELPDIRELREISPSDRAELLQMLAERPVGEYRHHQMITHAFLHGGIFHLAGNMLFMIVLGVSVNALVGNLTMAVVYPLLAVAGGVAHVAASRDEPVIPMVGASGAIMGLAGMYLVLFPVHKMYMAIWIRWGILAGFKLSWKVWALRGFWVVLFFISFDVLYTTLGVRDSTAHWAHLGGFIAGVVVGLVLLLTRLVNARGGDLLSVTLGRHAWKLLGKPVSRAPAAVPPPAPAAVVPVTSLNFPE